MKKYLSILTILVTGTIYAQIPLENLSNSDCNRDKNQTIILDQFNLEKDTTNYFNNTGSSLDTNTYYQKLNKVDEDTRLIYFVHGLGGNDKSWDAVDDAHTNKFIYSPLRVDYEEHQRDFDEASFEVYNEMNRLRISALEVNGQSLSTELPYAIGHSQGGLILRDMDRKYEQNFDVHFSENHRQFYGMISFCVPHAGAKIATSQEELLKLSSDFSNVLGNAVIKNQIAKFSLKFPFFSKQLQRVSNSATNLVESLSTDLIPSGINIVSKGQQAPMTKQYDLNSTFLTNELNYNNANLPKALFYAEESDPILFKIATFMVGPSASDFVHYDRFGANDDMQIANGVNELRAKLIADKSRHQSTIEKLKKKINRTNIPVIGLAYLVTVKRKRNQLKLHEDAVKAEDAAISFIEKANFMYKVITGSVNINPFGQRKKIGYWCVTEQKEIEVKLPYLGKRTTTVDIKHRVTDKSDCMGLKTIPIYERRIVEYKSDAVVTVSSQTALPGCHDRYKHLLNEVRMYNDNGEYQGLKIQSDVNHIQMLNCSQTDEALRRIYEGRGVPEFFKLKEKK